MKSENLANPTPDQLHWHEIDISMMIHLPPQAYNSWYFTRRFIPAQKFNPTRLDTDQWAQAAISMGAKRIIFVAKHERGFCLWQTNTSTYGIKESPWKEGKGDIVAEMAASCRKYHIELGIYLSPADQYLGARVGGICATQESQLKYNQIYRTQLTELLTRYGDIVEIWFDGSLVIDVRDIITKYAPHAMILQSTLATIRWVGNERGYAPYPAWNGLKKQDAVMGIATTAQSDPDGDVWLPLEVDVPLRNHFWWWIPHTELTIRSVMQLMEIYYRSVGHGAVLLMNNSPDRSGRIPEKDRIRTTEFGNEIKKRFGTPLAQTSGTGNEIVLNTSNLLKFDHLILMEEIAKGERIREYRVDALVDSKWVEIVQGSSIGHKKIDFFKPITASMIRFRAIQSVGIPIIKMLAIYYVGVTPQFQREKTSVFNPFKINSWKDLSQSKWKIFKFPITQFCREATQYEMEIRPEGTYQASEIVQIKSVKLYHENVETPLYITPTDDPFKFHLNITGFEQKLSISVEMRKSIGKKVSGQIYLTKRTN